VSVTPDGRRAVSEGYENALRVWDLETGRYLSTLEGPTDWVGPVSVTPDGRRAVSGGGKTLGVWDLETGRYLSTLEGHSSWVYSVSVTPDGRGVVSGSQDHTLRVWDLGTGQCVGVHYAGVPISSVAVSGGEPRVVYGTSGGVVDTMLFANLSVGPPVLTAVRIRVFDTGEVYGRWDDTITSVCAWCGDRMPVPNPVLDIIGGITRAANLSDAQSPCLELPREAWDEPKLLSECPKCSGKLKFNPFVVDNRDRY